MARALTRTEGQAIVLAVGGREIRVEVARVEGSQIRLAVTAPDDVAIWREEAVDDWVSAPVDPGCDAPSWLGTAGYAERT